MSGFFSLNVLQNTIFTRIYTHMQDFTNKNANWYYTAGKVTFKAERKKNIKLARDKMKGGVFSAAINNLDLNTTSL